MYYKLLISLLILIVLVICFRNYLPKISFFNNKPQTLESNINNYEKELAKYDETIKLNPNDALAYFARGIILYQLGKYELSLLSYEKAIALDPKNFEFYINQGTSF